MSRKKRKPLLVVDERGRPLDRPALAAVLTKMVESELADLPGLLLPVVLKIPRSGGAYLDAYAFDRSSLRVHIGAMALREIENDSRNMRSAWQLRSRVADLAANFRSRVGSSSNFFRNATRSHVAVTAKPHRRTSEDTPIA